MYLLHQEQLYKAHLSQQSVCMRHPSLCPRLSVRWSFTLRLPPLQSDHWSVCCVLGRFRLHACRRGVCVHQSRHSLCSMCSPMSMLSCWKQHALSSSPRLSLSTSRLALFVSPQPKNSMCIVCVRVFACAVPPSTSTAHSASSCSDNDCVKDLTLHAGGSLDTNSCSR